MEWWQILAISLGGALLLFLLSIVLYRQFFKRFWDVVLSGVAIVVLSPLLLLLTVLGACFMRGNPFFTQKRPGKKDKSGNERVFRLVKFRTMLYPQTREGRRITDGERLECIEKGIDILSDEERLNKYGRFLRATSFDELPELFNILIGEMSIVGPRPLSTIYLPYYSETERRRHDIRPGLTGLAQIHGRNSASWKKRFEYDIKYVDHCSLFLDIKILFQTLFTVFKREGICQGEQRPVAFNIERQKELEEATSITCSDKDD